MRVFKDNPLLLIWLLILTVLVIYSLFHVRVSVNLNTPEKAQVSVKSNHSFLIFDLICAFLPDRLKSDSLLNKKVIWAIMERYT